jgi:peptidoglycan/xylan/chitin deacetylase (PgdA/CDA1 family)
MRKKNILKLALSVTGITSVRWRRLLPWLYVFNYHRIGNPENCNYNRDLYSCSAEQLKKHVTLLQERFDLVNCERLVHLVRQGYTDQRPLAMITFDDGYLDNYTLAFPILKEMGAPATFFLPTAFIGQRRLMWGDEIAWILRHARYEAIRLPDAPEPFSLAEAQIERSIQGVLRHLKKARKPFSESVELIRQACGGVSSPDQNDWPQFLDWAQAREMLAAGMDIGSHTHVHELLGRLPAGRQREELIISKEILEEKLRSRIVAVAYPVGARSAYSDETCRLAREAGYGLGFNFLRRTNRFPIEDALDIARFAVDDDMSAPSVKAMACFPKVFAS